MTRADQLEPVREDGSGPVEYRQATDRGGHCSLCGIHAIHFVDGTTNRHVRFFRVCEDYIDDLWEAARE